MKKKLFLLSFMFCLIVNVVFISDINKVCAEENGTTPPSDGIHAQSTADFIEPNHQYYLIKDIVISSDFEFPYNSYINCYGHSFIIKDSANVTFNNVTYFSNNPENSVPNIIIESPSAVLNINGGYFNNKLSNPHGNYPTFIKVNAGTVNFNAGQFYYNSTTQYGGAIISNGTVNISGGLFEGNYADMGGGAIYNTGILNITGGEFRGCNTINCGGAIYNTGNLSISGGKFTGCSSKQFGGANVYASNENISGEGFEENFFGMGGAIYNTGILTVSGGDFTDCSDFIYNDGNTSTCTINGGSFNSQSENPIPYYIACNSGSVLNLNDANNINFGAMKEYRILLKDSSAYISLFDSRFSYLCDNSSLTYNNASVSDRIIMKNNSSIFAMGNSAVNINCTDMDGTSSFTAKDTASCSGNIDNMNISLQSNSTFTGDISTNRSIALRGNSKVIGNITLAGSNENNCSLTVYNGSEVTGNVTSESTGQVVVAFWAQVRGIIDASNVRLDESCKIDHLSLEKLNGVIKTHNLMNVASVTIDCKELPEAVLSGKEKVCSIDGTQELSANVFLVNYNGRILDCRLKKSTKGEAPMLYDLYIGNDPSFKITYYADMSHLNKDYLTEYSTYTLPYTLPVPKIPDSYTFSGWRVSAKENALKGKVITLLPEGTSGDLILVPVFTKKSVANSIPSFGQSSNYRVLNGDNVSVNISDPSYTNYRITSVKYYSASKTWVYTIAANSIADNSVKITEYAFSMS